MSIHIAEFAISKPRDITWASQRARLLASLVDLPTKRAKPLGKAVETVLRAFQEGTVQFSITEIDEQQAVLVVIRRQLSGDGPFEQFDEQLLVEAVDRVEIEADDLIESVSLFTTLPDSTKHISAAAASEWAIALAQRSTTGALATSQQRIATLAEQLQQAEQTGSSLQSELNNLRSLHDTLELLALVASKTDNAVVILDSQHRVEWVNDSFVRMTGFEQAEVYQQPLATVFYPEAGGGEEVGGLQELRSAFLSGHGVSQEILHTRKDGRTYWASLSITPAFDDEGKLHRWIGIASDATRQRREQEQLQQAKEAAEVANQIKGEFLANMSHELRTPMSAIIGMSELALDTELNEEQQEYVATILDSAENLSGLLNDILDLSKIEAKKLAIESVAFDLKKLLADATKAFSFQAKRTDCELKLQTEETVPQFVFGDPTRIRQVITNLVGNALKFTNDGAVTVTTKVKRKSKHRSRIAISITDTGVGISKDKLSQIFDSFTQADTSITRRFGGTGLGLTISKQLVELMGGKLSASSELGAGSTFTFELSLKPSDPVEPKPDEERSDAVAKPLNVLVTDDNRANRSLARRILEKASHQVTEATDGQQALDALVTGEFDAVLMDVQMPEMDGLETTMIVRQSADIQPQPYIIAVTAHAMEGDRERCIAAGMDAYITKPLRARQLLALMEAVATTNEELAEDQTEPLPGQSPVVGDHNFSQALHRLEGDAGLLAEQMNYYLEDTPILIRDIQAAIESQNANQLEMSAHRLRGLSAGFDAEELVRITTALEANGRENRGDEPLRCPDELVAEWNLLCDGIRRYLAA